MSSSPFADVPLAPPDPILGLTDAFLADTNPNKVNLGVGVYQDKNGKVPVLRVVREAERLWYEKEDSKAYLPIDGAPLYRSEVQKLLFGSGSPLISEGRIVTAAALGGTGALKLGADFIRRFLPSSDLYLSKPSWENHRAVFETAGFNVKEYPYYDAASHGLDFSGMLKALSEMPSGSTVLLHASCHNPTGVDLDASQWHEVAKVMKARDLLPFVDFAYQGFGTGISEDAVAIGALASTGLRFLVASSFSKSFSLYRERVGSLNIVTGDPEEQKRVTSQLKRVIRTNYSNPSSHGGQVVAMVLSDPKLRQLWEDELREMRERIFSMRTRFVEGLAAQGVKRDFSFIVKQRGMFSYSGLELERVKRLRSEFGLYIVDSGRICVAALNDKNLDYVTSAIAKVS